MKKILFLLVAVLAVSCIDMGSPRHVLCYSGGEVIYAGETNGYVWDGLTYIEFRDAKSGTKMTIRNADCMIAEY